MNIRCENGVILLYCTSQVCTTNRESSDKLKFTSPKTHISAICFQFRINSKQSVSHCYTNDT